MESSVLPPFFYGAITGVAVGAVGALFVVGAKIVMNFIFGLYETGGVFVGACIVILCLLCCFLTAAIQHLCPSARGSGVPLAEGMARGMLRVKWLPAATALVSGSMLNYLCGMPLGSEGPAVGVGGLIGDGVGKLAKKTVGFRRYLITAGASAGFATAFNAPITGLCFAFEETHRRFSPSILASALACVITGVVTSQAIFYGLGQIPYLNALGVRVGAAVLPHFTQNPVTDVADFFKLTAVAAICGIACALLGVGFNKATEMFSKTLGKIRPGFLRLLPVFVLTAVLGLLSCFTIGSGEVVLTHQSTDTALWLLFLLLAVRLIMPAAASGSGTTGGLFVPMIAIGGLVGLIAAKLCGYAGLPGAYTPDIVMLCIAAFFAASVRAPITAIMLTVELSGSFVGLLPCVIAVAIATVLSDAMRSEPLYERALENIRDAAPLVGGTKSMTVVGAVREDSVIAYKRVRNIMWPYNSLVVGLKRDGKDVVPDGETELVPDDVITVKAENVDAGYFFAQMKEYIDIDAPTPEPGTLVGCDGFAATAHNTF